MRQNRTAKFAHKLINISLPGGQKLEKRAGDFTHFEQFFFHFLTKGNRIFLLKICEQIFKAK